MSTGSNKESASEHNAVVPSPASRQAAKRGYGFATSNVSHYSDHHSENLYRYKNISSDYMRETSPTRDDDKPAHELSTSRFAARNNADDDRPAIPTNTRRGIAQRTKDDDQPVGDSSSSRFASKRNDDDDHHRGTGWSTGGVVAKRNEDADQPAPTAGTDRFVAKRDNDDDDDDVVTNEEQ
jgi:hypothetical protein